MARDLEDRGERSLTFENCETAAQMIRARAGLDAVEPLPAISGVLTQLGFECVVRADHEMEGLEAFAMPSKNEIHFKQEIFERLLDDEPSARFLAMHEVAHGFFHDGQTRFFKMTGGNVLLPFLSDDASSETQADRISRASLMPREMADAEPSARRLAERARAPLSEAVARKLELVTRSARTIPANIVAAIKQQKALALESSGFRRSHSVLSPTISARLAWELAPLAEGLPSDEYRSIDGRYIVRWSRLNKMMPGGWRISGERIIPWEMEANC